MKPHFFILSLTLLMLSFSCKTTQDITDLSQLKKEIEMDKSPCFGTCPHYTLTIYEKGYASFEGKRDVDKMGLHTKKLSSKEYEGIKRAFESSNWFDLQDDYPSSVSDLPKTKITYHDGGESKSVTGDDLSLPSIVKGLDKLLSQIAMSDGWTPKEGSENKD